jgi:hypothetical protein
MDPYSMLPSCSDLFRRRWESSRSLDISFPTLIDRLISEVIVSVYQVGLARLYLKRETAHIASTTLAPPMQASTTLTFNSADILSSHLRSADVGSMQYTTTTVKKGASRQKTLLEGAFGTPDAAIDWKRRTFTISEETRDIGELRRKKATFSSCEMTPCLTAAS